MPGIAPGRAERMKFKEDLIGWINVSGKGWLYRQEVASAARDIYWEIHDSTCVSRLYPVHQ